MGSHEQVVFGHDRDSGLRAIIAIHDTTLGPSLGGVRMMPYPSEDDALADALALSRAMTYKFAAAGIDLGGGKSVIIGDPDSAKSDDLLRAFGRLVQSLGGRYIPGIDMGTTQEDMATIGLETEPVSCTGANPSPFTALGVFASIQGCLEHVTGSGDVEGVRVAVQGVGHVGEALARNLADAGADLVLADADSERVRRLADELRADVTDSDDIRAERCDVLAPCAVGGVIDAETISHLRCRIVAGAANNITADPTHAHDLRRAGITYAPDYVANAGGVALLDTERAGDPPERARQRCLDLRERMRDILARAEEEQTSTLDAADRIAEARLADARTADARPRRAFPHQADRPRGAQADQPQGARADVVRRYYELVDAGELEPMLALFTDDVTYRRPGYEPLRGKAAMREFYENHRVIEHGEHTLERVVDGGDQVAVSGEFHGRLRDGTTTSARFADVFDFEADRILRRDTYFDAPLV